MAYKLIDNPKGYLYVPNEVKIAGIAAVFSGKKSVTDVVSAAYTSKGREVPKSIPMAFMNWKRTITKKLEKGDKKIIALCKKHGILQKTKKKN